MTRMELLERVAEAATAWKNAYCGAMGAGPNHRETLSAAVDALAAHKEPDGETVEVRAAVLLNAIGQPSLCDVTTEQGSRITLKSWLRNGFQHVATITARVPIPRVPEIAATVEPTP